MKTLCWFALATCVWAQTPAVPAARTIRIDPLSAAHPFPHFWEQMFGSGRAVLSLRESYRNDLRQVKKVTDVHYVRFHAIFDRETAAYDEDQQGHPIYNWSYVDQIYDGLLENGVRPFVELSFMPAQLAANLQWHAFWYRPLPSPPKDYAKWEELVYQFTHHLVERYGRQEVMQWYFEVWNEPNIDFWTGTPKQSTYFELYDHAARAVKRADPGLRVGGPATAQAAWVGELIRHAEEQKTPLDFVSTHVYGNDRGQDVFGAEEDIPRSEMVIRAVKKVYREVQSSSQPKLPIIWSEYNASYKNEVDVTDSAFMGPWLAHTIRECDGMTSIMSYWTFSDVFEEQGIIKTPFYGGYGVMAEGSVPKAIFNAFALLHQLGVERLDDDSQDVLVTRKDPRTLAIAVWNYAAPGENGPAKTFSVSVKGVNQTKRYHVEIVDPQHGSSLDAWRAMGSPAFPTREQYAQLRSAAAATKKLEGPLFTLPVNGLALVTVRLK
jgi:xylan 1,4-beta-xylosidase